MAKIAVILGSDSDLPIMKDALLLLDEFKVAYEVMVLSAHRSPEETRKYIKKAWEKGTKIFIAGAGGAAHLPGVIAAIFPLPVIGVPIKTSTLQGVDSLYSIIQMPPGVPVATVGIDASKNAALLSLEILAISDKDISKQIIEYKHKLSKSILKKNQTLEKVGWKKYLENM